MDFALRELLPLAMLLLATGLVAGVVAGLLGVGGGIVVVPALYYGFGQIGVDPAVRMHLAVGTSLATVVFTAWRSAASHRRAGALDLELLRTWALPVLVGVLVGTTVGGVASGRALQAVFAVIALVVAFHMAFARESWRLADAPPRGAARGLVGAGIGFLSVLMGLGGGTLGVPTLTLVGVPIHRAVGTAAGLGMLIAVPGAIGFALSGAGAAGRPPFSLGYVNAVGFALIVPATVLAAPWGARLSHALSRRTLRGAFALFLALTSARMFLDLV